MRLKHFVLSRQVLAILCLLILMVSGCAVSKAAVVPALNLARPPTVALPSFSALVDEVMPSVVYVYVETTNARGLPVVVAGSGVILRPDGYILTNRHVVEGANRVEVTTHDYQVYAVSDNSIWLDDIMDLAVMKIDGNNLPTLEFGDPSSLRVGDWVVAVGHALGFSPQEGGASVTKGIISNLNRSAAINSTFYYDLIQTDAAINSGNSGGPLVNLAGEVIGINSIGAVDAQNIGYAINMATARHVFEDLVKYGRPHHPYLGVTLEDMTPSLAKVCQTQFCGGAVIRYVAPKGPVDGAGLRQNDVVIRFGEDDVASAAGLMRALMRHEAGDKVAVVFWRGGEQMKADIVLGERPLRPSGV